MVDYNAVAASINQQIATINAAQTTASAMITSAQTTAFVAAGAALASLIGAFVLWRNGFVQARATQQLKHAEFRQLWINGLREEMAKFFALAMHMRRLEDADEQHKVALQLQTSMMLILLRMNREDRHFKSLVEYMQGVVQGEERWNAERTRSTDGSFAQALEFTDPSRGYALTCQRILKTEWETTRDGMIEKPPRWKTKKEMEREKERRLRQDTRTGETVKIPKVEV